MNIYVYLHEMGHIFSFTSIFHPNNKKIKHSVVFFASFIEYVYIFISIVCVVKVYSTFSPVQ